MFKSYAVTLLTYVIALAVALCISSYAAEMSQWQMILAGYLSATVVIFIASQLFCNSSLYDPFWSVAPVPVVLYLAFWPISEEINLEKILLIVIPILFWAFRLTINWLRDWKGLSDEDFRYLNLKKKPFSFLIDLFGIHIYPTLQVYFSLLPIYFALSIITKEANIALYASSLFTFFAVILETVSDEQMRTFRHTYGNEGITMKKGLWQYSRHPNYLGEILFWWGLFFMTISLDTNYWYLFVCPLVMNLMFSLITCRMMDQRSLERRSDYEAYMHSTRQLIIWKSDKRGQAYD